MPPYLLAALPIFGLVIGSFLNVVAYRVPRGESIRFPASHCPSCQQPIAARDNIPIFGWLLLRGKCRSCAAPIRARYPIVEALTGLAFLAVGLRFGLDWQLPAFLYLAAIAMALAVIDLDVQRLPDAIVLPSFPVGIALLLAPSIANQAWWSLGRGLLAAIAIFASFFVLQLLQPKGMGYGDTKTAALLALHLGWLGWAEVGLGIFMGFLLGALWGIAVMLRGAGTRKSKIPFGPFLLAGAFLAILIPNLFIDWYLNLFR